MTPDLKQKLLYMKKPLLIFSAIVAASVSSASAQVLAQWTFETSTSTNNIIGAGLSPASAQSGVNADIGTGTGSAFHATAATVWSIPAGNGNPHAWSANMWSVGDYFQFSTSTVGFSGVKLSYDQVGSGTGPRDFNLQYSLDGSSFTTFASYSLNSAVTSWSTVTANPLSSFSFDLSSVTALNNAPNVYFRITDTSTTSINGGAVGTAGSGRVDNFTIAVPEPAAALLTGFGLMAVLVIRRRR